MFFNTNYQHFWCISILPHLMLYSLTQMNTVLGRIASTAKELSHYHSGEGIFFIHYFISVFWFCPYSLIQYDMFELLIGVDIRYSTYLGDFL